MMGVCLCRGLRSEYEAFDEINENSNTTTAEAMLTVCCTMSISSVLLSSDLVLWNPGEEVERFSIIVDLAYKGRD